MCCLVPAGHSVPAAVRVLGSYARSEPFAGRGFFIVAQGSAQECMLFDLLKWALYPAKQMWKLERGWWCCHWQCFDDTVWMLSSSPDCETLGKIM